MTYKPAHHLHNRSKQAQLAYVADIVDTSGVLKIIKDHTPPPALTSNRGRKEKYQPITLRAYLILVLYFPFAGRAASWANVTRALWIDFQPQDLDILKLPKDWRHPERHAQIHLGTQADATQADKGTAAQVFHAETKRLRDHILDALDPMAFNALPANRRQTKDAVQSAYRSTVELRAAEDLCNKVMNRLVWASLVVANKHQFPNVDPTDLHHGVLRDWASAGDIGVDEHEVAISTGAHSGKQNPGKQLAKVHAKHRRHKHPGAIGLTNVMAASRPHGRRVPSVFIGIALKDPSPASTPGVLTAIDAATSNGLFTKLTGNQRRYFIADMGYTQQAVSLLIPLLDRGFNPVWTYPKRWKHIHDLAPAPAENEPATTGPYTFNGCVVCPGYGLQALKNLGRFTRPGKTIDAPDTDETIQFIEPTPAELAAHAERERVLAAHTMTRNKRPERMKRATRGRPRKNEPELTGLWKEQVTCPATEFSADGTPKIQCPLVAESLTVDTNIPTVLNPPTPPDHDDPNAVPLPPVCQRTNTTIVYTDEQLKSWQPLMVGTFAHTDQYETPRSRTEFVFSQLTADTGGNLDLGTIKWNLNNVTSLAITAAVVATNTSILESFADSLDRDTRLAPPETGRANRENRDNWIARHRANPIQAAKDFARRDKKGRSKGPKQPINPGHPGAKKNTKRKLVRKIKIT